MTPKPNPPRFPLWQITFPLAIVLIFGLGSLTAVFLVQGRYLFDLEAGPKHLKIRTDVDKREPLPNVEEAQRDNPNQDSL